MRGLKACRSKQACYDVSQSFIHRQTLSGLAPMATTAFQARRG
jgi:hypothetical protein